MKKNKTAPAKKPVAKKKVIAKPKVEMVSYSIKMVIPTGAYANIQPEIIVKSGSIDEAHAFIAPHMNKLWKEYFMVNERRPEPPKTQPVYPTTGTPTVSPIGSTTAANFTGGNASTPVQSTQTEMIIDAFGGKVVEETPVQPPESSVAFIKATQAIESCLSLEALELIQNQVNKSVKLTHEDKEMLMPLLEKKSIELTFPEDGK